jgi:DNA-nicking Smr family endonuclease
LLTSVDLYGGKDFFLQTTEMKEPELTSDAVEVPIEDWIDLHTFLPRDVPSLLTEYLTECRKKRFREVRIIHGKGKGVQRNIVHSFLERSPLVESFKSSPPEAGSWGATLVYLKKG